jgi:hypothetical protein
MTWGYVEISNPTERFEVASLYSNRCTVRGFYLADYYIEDYSQIPDEPDIVTTHCPVFAVRSGVPYLTGVYDIAYITVCPSRCYFGPCYLNYQVPMGLPTLVYSLGAYEVDLSSGLDWTYTSPSCVPSGFHIDCPNGGSFLTVRDYDVTESDDAQCTVDDGNINCSCTAFEPTVRSACNDTGGYSCDAQISSPSQAPLQAPSWPQPIAPTMPTQAPQVIRPTYPPVALSQMPSLPPTVAPITPPYATIQPSVLPSTRPTLPQPTVTQPNRAPTPETLTLIPATPPPSVIQTSGGTIASGGPTASQTPTTVPTGTSGSTSLNPRAVWSVIVALGTVASVVLLFG